MLGTFVEIEAQGDALAIDRGFEAIAEIHRLMSFHEETSDLARIRNAPLGEVVPVSRHTVNVLRTAIELFDESGGLFDISVGYALVRDGFLPAPGKGWRHARGTLFDLEILDDCSLRCHRPLLIDLGGIAKGYAVDCAVEAMRAAGCSRGLVNAGGDLKVFGDQAREIALRDADGSIHDSIVVQNAALASSSNLHLRRWRMGRWRTVHRGLGGRPVLSDRRVSVMADRCVIADAMTKVAMADRPLAERMIARRGGQILFSDATRAAA